MEIKTKLNIDDKCFFLMNNKVCEAMIKLIDVSVSIAKYPTIIYTIDKNPIGIQYTNRFYEHEVFGNKQDLLTSL